MRRQSRCSAAPCGCTPPRQNPWRRPLRSVPTSRGATSVEVTEAAQDAYLRQLAADLAGTVWMAGGCQSWYQDANGQATTMWPGTVAAYRRLLSRFEPADHELRTRVGAVA